MNGLRIGWIFFALLVAALAVSGWFILAGDNQSVAGRPTIPPVLGGSGSIDRSPATRSPAEPSRTQRSEGPRDSVAGVDTVRTITCVDNVVSVSGVRNNVTVNGHCNRVEVSGVENTVSIDDSDAIEVSGIRNQVRFRSAAPQLTKSGIDNTLERG